MPVCALIDGSGSVINVIVADAGFRPPDGLTMVDSGGLPVAVGWTHGPGGFVAPEPVAAPAAPLAALALAALDNSDMTALRCWKAGVPFPAAWQAYDAALRSIVNGGTGPLPTMPAYPAGT